MRDEKPEVPAAIQPGAGESARIAHRQRPPRRGPWLLAVVILAAGAFYLIARTERNPKQGGEKGGQKEQPAPAVPVVATRARRGRIGVYLNGLGGVTPLNTVTVRSRVDGELTEVGYREGDMIQKGDLLVQIDPRPFQVQLEQAQGQLMRDQATLENARIDLARYLTLIPQKAIPEQQVATQRATVAQLEGTVKSDQAQVDEAKLNLSYSRITAPITGRVGLRLVDPGNIVHAGDANGLVVITQIQPTSVIFTIAEDQLSEVAARRRAGKRLRVDAYNRDMKTLLAQGTLTSIDNQVDQTTGTVRLRATFENNDGRLFSNEFVNVRLLLAEKQNVVLLQTAAIQRSTDRIYAYIVKSDSTVMVRQIQVGTTEGEDSEITSGLDGTEVVVMTGVDKLQEGSPVKVQMQSENGAGAGGKRN